MVMQKVTTEIWRCRQQTSKRTKNFKLFSLCKLCGHEKVPSHHKNWFENVKNTSRRQEDEAFDGFANADLYSTSLGQFLFKLIKKIEEHCQRWADESSQSINYGVLETAGSEKERRLMQQKNKKKDNELIYITNKARPASSGEISKIELTPLNLIQFSLLISSMF